MVFQGRWSSRAIWRINRDISRVGAGEVAIAASAVAGDAGLQRAGVADFEVGGCFLPDPVAVLAHCDITYGRGAGGVVVQGFDQDRTYGQGIAVIAIGVGRFGIGGDGDKMHIVRVAQAAVAHGLVRCSEIRREEQRFAVVLGGRAAGAQDKEQQAEAIFHLRTRRMRWLRVSAM